MEDDFMEDDLASDLVLAESCPCQPWEMTCLDLGLTELWKMTCQLWKALSSGR